VGFLGEKIREFVSNGEKFGLSIDYCWDGAVPQGTAGALRKASPLLGDAFFVVYGDAYLPCNYRAVEDAFFRSRKSALMTIFRNEGRWGASNVEFVNEQILAYDKLHLTPRMHHIDYGLGVFLQSALAAVPDGPCDLSTVYQGLLQRNDLASFHVSERFYEVGSFDGIESFSKLKLENYE
jgi:NDP-sugar pyrophosphorylase family protein